MVKRNKAQAPDDDDDDGEEPPPKKPARKPPPASTKKPPASNQKPATTPSKTAPPRPTPRPVVQIPQRAKQAGPKKGGPGAPSSASKQPRAKVTQEEPQEEEPSPPHSRKRGRRIEVQQDDGQAEEDERDTPIPASKKKKKKKFVMVDESDDSVVETPAKKSAGSRPTSTAAKVSPAKAVKGKQRALEPASEGDEEPQESGAENVEDEAGVDDDAGDEDDVVVRGMIEDDGAQEEGVDDDVLAEGSEEQEDPGDEDYEEDGAVEERHSTDVEIVYVTKKKTQKKAQPSPSAVHTRSRSAGKGSTTPSAVKGDVKGKGVAKAPSTRSRRKAVPAAAGESGEVAKTTSQRRPAKKSDPGPLEFPFARPHTDAQTRAPYLWLFNPASDGEDFDALHQRLQSLAEARKFRVLNCKDLTGYDSLVALTPDYEFSDMVDALDLNIRTLVATSLASDWSLHACEERMDALEKRLDGVEGALTRLEGAFTKYDDVLGMLSRMCQPSVNEGSPPLSMSLFPGAPAAPASPLTHPAHPYVASSSSSAPVRQPPAQPSPSSRPGYYEAWKVPSYEPGGGALAAHFYERGVGADTRTSAAALPSHGHPSEPGPSRAGASSEAGPSRAPAASEAAGSMEAGTSRPGGRRVRAASRSPPPTPSHPAKVLRDEEPEAATFFVVSDSEDAQEGGPQVLADDHTHAANETSTGAVAQDDFPPTFLGADAVEGEHAAANETSTAGVAQDDVPATFLGADAVEGEHAAPALTEQDGVPPSSLGAGPVEGEHAAHHTAMVNSGLDDVQHDVQVEQLMEGQDVIHDDVGMADEEELGAGDLGADEQEEADLDLGVWWHMVEEWAMVEMDVQAFSAHVDEIEVRVMSLRTTLRQMETAQEDAEWQAALEAVQVQETLFSG
ncbi:hypothetical protein K466DRAFT_570378 [Polyporus arcularius HHB13444]|uniref:Uncharacterized protein n=1 Tax=Polyporus arcularius HHB13444 TaxID=1314778 RepID=A0A5C3P0C9_9APHY|nr:hypothetical protein K466DRAFT_570378 [Polyporus arcularius HHB13444]